MLKVEKLEMTKSEKLYHKLLDGLSSIMSEEDEKNSFIESDGFGKVFVKKSYVLIKKNTVQIVNRGNLNPGIIMRIKNIAELMNFEVIK